MKKISSIIVLALVLISLIACTKNTNNAKPMPQNKKMQVDKTNMKDDKMKEELKNKGELAKDFALEDLDGNIYKLSEQKGKKIYIKFWASWCPICLASLSELNEESKNQKDYEIITVVSPGQLGEQNKEDFIKWFKSLNYPNIKVLLDEKGELIKTYNIKATPTNILIGSDGVLIRAVPGQLNKEALKNIYTEIK